MVHHLQKAKQLYTDEGLLSVCRSGIRYLPIEINNTIFRIRHGSGTKIMEEDWDNLIILDACRYDMFADQVDLSGTLESRVSLGSSSEEFLERNFMNSTNFDTVYVNSNPYVPKLGLDENTFHAVIDCLSEWDSSLETVHPDTVADAARAAHKEYPEKRLIIHFMQPHTPFIGDAGKNMRGGVWDEKHDDGERGLWQPLEDGTINTNIKKVWQAYRENLDVVLEVVEDLLEVFDGKSVVTSDHGNLVGERLSPVPTRPKFGHPYGVHVKELVKVPWFVVDGDDRRKVTTDPPTVLESVESETVEDRLTSLGYK